MNPEPPTRYAKSNDRNNDAWDHDAVCWILDRLGPSTAWNYGAFFECARKQSNRKANDLDRVIEAARVCGSLGVDQLDVRDPNLGKDIVRLRRTDAEAPTYPSHYDTIYASTTMRIDEEDRAAARRLLGLLGAYEAELVAAGKSPSTITTYIDRTERFLRRVVVGE